MTVAQQPEGIGRRACGGKVLSFKDLQLYQQNQNDGEEHNNNSHIKTVSWKNESDEEDHLYELIRGVPAVIVSNRNSQSNIDFIPKRNLIGRKIVKIGKTVFLVKKTFFEDERKSAFLCEAGATAFEVSLGGFLTRSFKGMEFIVSLPIIRRKGKSEFAEFLHKKERRFVGERRKNHRRKGGIIKNRVVPGKMLYLS